MQTNFKLPVHNFCWVSMAGKTGNVISADLSIIENFSKEGFDVKIPYYLSKLIDRQTRKEMEKDLKKLPYKVENFDEILEEDKRKNPKLGELAFNMKCLIEATENIVKNFSADDQKNGHAICIIVDAIKMYISAKENEMAIDYNVKLESKENYLKKLEESQMLLSNGEFETGYPENKLIYVANNNSNKISFAKNVT